MEGGGQVYDKSTDKNEYRLGSMVALPRLQESMKNASWSIEQRTADVAVQQSSSNIASCIS
jgi:hypothetical protein